MKVNNILTESVNTQLTESFNFNDLSSMQIAALRAIENGRMDFDNASDRMLDVMYELTYNGLLDDNYDITPAGYKALELALKYGGSKERRRAAQQKNVDVDDIYNDTEDLTPTDDDYLDNDDNYPDTRSSKHW